MMHIQTTRFGPVAIEPDDILLFPEGLLGMENCQHWVLLADIHHTALAWLQSTERPDIALAVVSPRRFVPNYQLRVSRRELAPLKLQQLSDAQVLAIVGKTDQAITLNLKGPIVIHLAARLGRQVIANGDAPLQYELVALRAPLKKSA